MKLRSIIIIFLILAALPSSPEAQAQEVDELVAQAFAANPDLAAMATQVTALQERSEGARMWADPVFSVEYSSVPYDTLALDESPMSGVQFVLRQALPFPGKNARREATAVAETEVMQWRLAERKVQLAGLLRQTYWQLALTRRLAALTDEHLKLVEQLRQAVGASYQTGRAGQADLLRLDILAEKLREDRRDFTRDEATLTAKINAALHRDPGTPIVTPAQIPPTSPQGELAALIERADADRPLLKMWRAAAQQKEEAARLARAEPWPDVSVWAGDRYREELPLDPGDDFVSFGLAFPLPLDVAGQYRAKRRALTTEAGAARQELEAARNDIRGALAADLAQWQRASDKARLYRDRLVPLARTTLESTLAAWQTGRADFTALYQAQAQLIDFERVIAQAQFTAMNMKIGVDALIGETGE